jgi:hypothetical protein
MTQEQYREWLAECIKDNICTYHHQTDCGCYYWTGIKEQSNGK